MRLHTRTTMLLTLLLLLSACTSAFCGKTVYVKTTGSDTADGLTWSTAKKTVQAGINAAVADDEVWVAEGNYVQCITLRSGVGLYGGFTGTEVLRNQRNWSANSTVLDGNQQGWVVTSPSKAGNSTVIDGFAVMNGSYGGIRSEYSSPTIRNNRITRNSGGNWASAIYCTDSTAVITGNTIVGNYGPDTAAAITCQLRAYVSITNNTIVGNTCSGLNCSYSSSCTVANNIIAFNGGGVQKDKYSPWVFKNNCVYGNGGFNYYVGNVEFFDPTGLDGNISVDPKLSGITLKDTHIQSDSPCRDTGDNSVIQSGSLDMDCQERIKRSLVDIGADESDGTVWFQVPMAVVRVRPDGDDANDGSSWSQAKRTIQAAIDAISVDGGEVWVKAGTYTECIALRPYVYLYGGFSGSEMTVTERDYALNRTIIDGQGRGDAVTSKGTGVGLGCIDGFTIRNASTRAGIVCSASGITIANNRVTRTTNAISGGSCLSIRNNTVLTNNSGISGQAVSVSNNTIASNGGSGLGLTKRYSSSTGFPDVAIINNIIAFNGRGVDASYEDVHPVLQNNCVFGNVLGNYVALNDPTGVDGNLALDPRFVSISCQDLHIQPDSPCLDAGNDSILPPGVLDADGRQRILGAHVDIGADEQDGTLWPTPALAVVHVANEGDDSNRGLTWEHAKRTIQAGIDAASATGGEVWVKAGQYSENIQMRPCAYVYGGFGGGETDRDQRDWKRYPTILDGGRRGRAVTAQFIGPGLGLIDGFAITRGDPLSQGTGGGIYCLYAHVGISHNTIRRNVGGVNCSWSAASIHGNIVAGNTSGGIACSGCRPAITQNTVVGNSFFGILYTYLGPSVLANNIVAFNTIGISGDARSDLIPRSNCVFGNLTGEYSGTADPTGANGNISVDPLLVGAEYGDAHIQPQSPCRDAGDVTIAQTGDRDLDAQFRGLDGHLDIGADESDGVERTIEPMVIRVSEAGDDAADGLSWDHAKRTVQSAIDTAAKTGGEVWVQAGTYNEVISIPSFVYVYGGFNGSETSRSQRDWRSSQSVLCGPGNATVVTVDAGHAYCTVDGFKITGGSLGIYCDYSYAPIAHNRVTGNNSAGISCDHGAPSIHDNMVSGNQGWGITCECSSAMIVSNRIRGNSGGISTDCGSGGDPRPIIAGNVIDGNSSSDVGAGVHLDGGSPTLANNTIIGNDNRDKGAVYIDCCAPVIANNIIAHNSSGIRRVSGYVCSEAVLRGNCVYGNSGFNYSAIADQTGVNGNISADPKLVSSVYGDIHISPDSPCRDSGSDIDVLLDTDIDGTERIQGEHVDIGVDESGGAMQVFSPAVVRVNTAGDDAHSGDSWGNAKRTVQAAVDALQYCGGMVWVANGTYSESVLLKPYTYIYGGFAGTESSLAERDWRRNLSVLDGQSNRRPVTIERGFRCSAIDGLVIRNGRSTYGGGILCSYASPSILNNTIVENTATSSGGGGIQFTGSSAVITGNAVSSNHTYGSASGAFISNSAVILQGNLFCQNGNPYPGDSCITLSNSQGWVTSNTMIGNGGQYGALSLSSSSPRIANNIIAFNQAGIRSLSSQAILRNNDVFGNTAFSYRYMSAGQGDISADPMFVDRLNGDYHLRSGSPCIDTGWNDAPGLAVFDIDDQPRIMDCIVDIGADEYPYGLSLANTKPARDNASVWLDDAIVTAAFDGFFYIETEDRSMGIRVEEAGHGLQAGAKVSITGVLITNADGERCIEASTVTPTGTGSIEPLHIVSRYLGGVDWFYNPSTGAGQKGVVGGIGLNNIGMLVTTWGKLNYLNGVASLGDTKVDAAKTVLDGIRTTGLDTYVRITGVVSCYKDAGGLHPTILASEITPL